MSAFLVAMWGVGQQYHLGPHHGGRCGVGLLGALPLVARQGVEGPWCGSETSVVHSLFLPYNLSVEG